MKIEPVGYIDEFGNFEPAMLPWMQEEPGVAWVPVYKHLVPTQPAQEPAETVTLVGIKDGIETVLGTVSTPPEMKAREIIRNYGWNPDDQDDFGEGETAMCIINDLLAWIRRQGAPKIELAAPTQPALTYADLEACREVAAKTFRHHKSSIRGQQLSEWDDCEWHLAKAIEAHCRGGAKS